MHVGRLTIRQHGNGTKSKIVVRQDGGLKKKQRRIYWRGIMERTKQMDVCEECEDQIAGMLDKFQERMKDNDLLSGATVQPDAAGQNQESSDNSEE